MYESEMRQEIAVLLFEKEKLTLAQAARLAGMKRLAFQQLLAGREISIHYAVEEFEQDLRTLRDLGRL
jgi:predicted HTH domain antitoxin